MGSGLRGLVLHLRVNGLLTDLQLCILLRNCRDVGRHFREKNSLVRVCCAWGMGGASLALSCQEEAWPHSGVILASGAQRVNYDPLSPSDLGSHT
jgi:hypothetical protein